MGITFDPSHLPHIDPGLEFISIPTLIFHDKHVQLC